MNSWDQLLKLVRCPIDHSPLQEADTELLEQLNSAIERGGVTDRVGQTVEGRIDSALVNENRTWLYPVVGGIPSLIADEAIDAQRLQANSSS